jgi:hypothetical protein
LGLALDSLADQSKSVKQKPADLAVCGLLFCRKAVTPIDAAKGSALGALAFEQ